mmetsp:Transcript_29247/g.32487  ORF Transcript_29247/g.32487 Transcript_29247/m.32487 type:complete len:95 (+) Transcript_29247:185-469(+)
MLITYNSAVLQKQYASLETLDSTAVIPKHIMLVNKKNLIMAFAVAKKKRVVLELEAELVARKDLLVVIPCAVMDHVLRVCARQLLQNKVLLSRQ